MLRTSAGTVSGEQRSADSRVLLHLSDEILGGGERTDLADTGAEFHPNELAVQIAAVPIEQVELDGGRVSAEGRSWAEVEEPGERFAAYPATYRIDPLEREELVGVVDGDVGSGEAECTAPAHAMDDRSLERVRAA